MSSDPSTAAAADCLDIDHVVLAARSREDAERELARAGLGIARGRTIPGLGLSNLVVPTGGSSALEIHYPNGEPLVPDAPPLLDIQRRKLAARPEAALLPVAWLLLVEDPLRIRRLAASNNVPVMEAAAEGPGFPPYTLVGFGANIARPWLPCFIHWPVPEAERPAALNAVHRRRPTGITRIEVAGPGAEIYRWCSGAQPQGLRIVPGVTGPQLVEVGFDDGTSAAFGVASSDG